MTTEINTAWRARFLEVLAEGSTVEKAARMAGVHRTTAWRQRQADREFAEAWDQAIESGTDLLEEVALQRATSGHSDMLLLALLKARRPERFQERQRLEHVRVDYRDAQEELERMARKVLEDDEERKLKELPSS